MNDDKFWQLVEAAKAGSTPELSNQPELLRIALEALPADEIAAFDRIFRTLCVAAYRWDLWAAAYIIEGGCSDDGFTDFRSGLVGLGRKAYHDALRDPRTLVEQPARGVDFSQEALAYVASEAYEAATGSPLPDQGIELPDEPAGEPWDEDTVAELYPELAEKFGLE
jgi:hypothetical protein